MAILDLKSKFLGCMIGSALGDAIGELAFSYRNKQSLMLQLKQRPKLFYTDNTAMVIGLAESIVETGGLDPQNLEARLKYNFQRDVKKIPATTYSPTPRPEQYHRH